MYLFLFCIETKKNKATNTFVHKISNNNKYIRPLGVGTGLIKLSTKNENCLILIEFYFFFSKFFQIGFFIFFINDENKIMRV
jgi:hypothetical protein